MPLLFVKKLHGLITNTQAHTLTDITTYRPNWSRCRATEKLGNLEPFLANKSVPLLSNQPVSVF